MPSHRVGVWWIGERAAEHRTMEHARAHVERAFGWPATLVDGAERPTGTLDRRRGQHLSAGILRWMTAARPPGAAKVLAITDVDLFIPILTFVFGEAQLGGDVAVVSTARLGEPADRAPGIVTDRLVKECIHELGHTFGLIHCADPRCAMARSASVAHVDAKRAALCATCRMKFREISLAEDRAAQASMAAGPRSSPNDRGDDAHGR